MSIPIACTLPAPQMQERLATIAALARRTLISHEQDGRTLRLRYAKEAEDELAQLVAEERVCCSFLDFELLHRPEAVHLLITSPAGAEQFTTVFTSHFLGKVEAPAEGCSASCSCRPSA